MTLDEAVKRAEEVAENCERGNPKKRSKFKCASEHRQLAEWLKELKAYKEQQPCEDAISRAELLKNQTVIIDDDGLAHKVVHIGRICAAPSVIPTREK